MPSDFRGGINVPSLLPGAMPPNGSSGQDPYYGSGPGFDIGDLFDVYDIGRDVYRGLTGPGNGNGAAAPGAMPARESAQQLTKSGCVPLLAVERKTIAKCPPGYVAVDTNGDGVTDACAHKSVARCYGWRPSAKPPIKARDWKALRKASGVVKKLDRVVKMANEVTGKARLTRSRPSKK